MLKIENLSLWYDDNHILDDLSLHIKPSTMVGIKGYSGSGKSSLLSCITSMIPTILPGVIKGNIYLDNQNIKDLNHSQITKNITMIFQNSDSQLFFSTVEAEIVFGLENHGVDVREIDKIVDDALALVDMQDKRYTDTKLLSGGQKQLVLLAAVLAIKPKLLLLDEALCHIDNIHCQKIFKILKQYVIAGGSVLLIDHRQDHLSNCDIVYYLKDKKLYME